MVGLLIPHGHEQASELVRELRWLPLSAVYSSPVPRALETAQPIADDHSLDVRLRPALDDLSDVPNGHQHFLDELLTLARRHPGETVAIVTHVEPIRSALAAFAGRSVADLESVDIQPGRITAVGISPTGVRTVLGVNVTAREAVL